MSSHVADGEEIKKGCPPGKAVLWVSTVQRGFLSNSEIILSGYLIYDELDEALAAMGRLLKFHDGQSAHVNYKSEDGSKLETWTLRHGTINKK